MVAPKQTAARYSINIQAPQDGRRDGGLPLVQVSVWSSSRFPAVLTNVISSNVKAEVGGGIVTSGLFFHGTNRACTLGDNRTEDELCNKKKCSLCAIIRDSYDVDKTGMWPYGLVHILDFVADMNLVGSKHGFSRFGPGIYTSACSSSETLSPPPASDDRVANWLTEADDYFKDIVSSSKIQSRALLLNAVVYGNPQKLFHTDTTASSLRFGYHSVGTPELNDSTRFG